jgi:site-specific DNA-methyltransferase (adenine-specific)
MNEQGTLIENKIYNQDCCIGMRERIPDNSIDLIVTSPPYNLGIKYDSYDDKKPLSEYFAWCREWLTECYRVLKPDGRMCLNHYLSCGTSETRFAPLMRMNCVAEDIGFRHHGCAVWDDRTLTNRNAWGSWLSASAPYLNSPYEGIIILYKDHWKKDRAGETDITPKEFMECASGVWKIQPCRKYDTIANFPIELPRRCIRFFSYVDDIVLDPFSGAGITCLAAKQARRKYIGFEISPNYYKKSLSNLPQELVV